MKGQIKAVTACVCAALTVGASAPMVAQSGWAAGPRRAALSANNAGPRGSSAGATQQASINGTISSVSPSQGTITLTSAASSTPVVISLTANTSLVGYESIPVSALAVGDTLLITGIPLTVEASSIVDDKTGTSASAGSSTTTGAAQSRSSASTAPEKPVTCVVTALSPLTVTVNKAFTITITGNSSTTVSEAIPVTLSELAPGDTVSAQVTPSGNGVLVATQVHVTAP